MRTPSRGERTGELNLHVLAPGDPLLPLPFPVLLVGHGNANFISEELLAYELGYRVLVNEQLSLDTALFYNIYDKILLGSFGILSFVDTPPPGYFLLPVNIGNNMNGETYGFEVSAKYRPFPWWTLSPAYSLLRMQLNSSPTAVPGYDSTASEQNPVNQVSLRSSFDLRHDVSLDFWLRYVDELPSMNIPAYVTLDVRLGWRPNKKFELSIVGQDLFDNHHPEFGSPIYVKTVPTETQRSVYAQVTWHF